MEIIYLKECSSTQTLLREKVKSKNISSEGLLVATKKQTAGYGRRGNQWENSSSHALFFSFTAPKEEEEKGQLVSLEIPLKLSLFFEEYYQRPLSLTPKWPNDLYNSEKKKCAGIVLHADSDSPFLSIGVGVNLTAPENASYGGILHHTPIFSEDFYWKIPLLFTQFFHKTKISSSEIIASYNKHSLFLHEAVELKEKDHLVAKGIYKGIGKQGEIILQTEKGEESFFTGSLVKKS